MTNLLFGTNVGIIQAAVTASSTATGYSGSNLLSGPRGNGWKTDGAVAAATIKTNQAIAVNFIALAGAHTLSDVPASTVTLDLEYSDDDSSYTAWYEGDATAITALCTNSASGEDWHTYGAISDSHTYWRLTVTPSADATIELSKLYLGTALDIGRDPAAINLRRRSAGQFEYRSGYEIQLEYQGIDFDQAESLQNNIVSRAAYHPLFLFTTESETYSHGPLGNGRLYFVELIDYSMPQKITGQNDVSLTFRESL